MRGDCRLRCDADGRCPPKRGIPFFCAAADGSGDATQFGAPCLDDSECFEQLSSIPIGPDNRSQTNYNPNICTLSCTTDADCDANHLTFHGGFCQTDIQTGNGHCRLSGSAGAPYSQPTHCRSRRCSPEGVCLD